MTEGEIVPYTKSRSDTPLQLGFAESALTRRDRVERLGGIYGEPLTQYFPVSLAKACQGLTAGWEHLVARHLSSHGISGDMNNKTAEQDHPMDKIETAPNQTQALTVEYAVSLLRTAFRVNASGEIPV